MITRAVAVASSAPSSRPGVPDRTKDDVSAARSPFYDRFVLFWPKNCDLAGLGIATRIGVTHRFAIAGIALLGLALIGVLALVFDTVLRGT